MFGELPDSSLIAVLRHVMISSPVLAEESIRPDYLNVIRRCLDPDRMERYPTAAALAEDLDRTEGLVNA